MLGAAQIKQLMNVIRKFRHAGNSLSNYFTFYSKGLFFTWFFQSFVIDNKIKKI